MYVTPKYAISHYSDNADRQGLPGHSYNYWNWGCYFQIVGDKPFQRGDAVGILEVLKPSQTECTIKIVVLGPADRHESILSESGAEIPRIVAMSSSFPLNPEDHYTVKSDEGVEIVSLLSNVVHGNIYHTVVALVTGSNCEVNLVNAVGEKVCGWVISDRSDG